MIEVLKMVQAIEYNDPNSINIEWRKGSSQMFQNKKPVELYLDITNDPDKFLNKMSERHKHELTGGFKWPADTLGTAIERSRQLMKHYGCTGDVPTIVVDESKPIYLAAEVIYRGVN